MMEAEIEPLRHRCNAAARADDFINIEKEYHLGFLPVEQANPRTRTLYEDFLESEEKGVGVLLSVDRELVELFENALKSKVFAKLTDAFFKTLSNGNRIIFSGCGSSGRLCILVESAYRNYLKTLRREHPDVYQELGVSENQVMSIMTGGDYALIRSVENFEDYFESGRLQAEELAPGPGDMLVGITATGETTSILGTVDQALACGAEVFFVISVSKEIPEERLQRVRQIFAHPNVTVFDMSCVPMAIAGSTRMQATTLEELVVGAALEMAIKRLLDEKSADSRNNRDLKSPVINYHQAFNDLLDALMSKDSLTAVADVIRLEEKIYRAHGLITYYADDLLLDIITDTTERSPTFSLPPFRQSNDHESPRSWAFAKNPVLDTHGAWVKLLGREPRCINWTTDDYKRMAIPDSVAANPPRISAEELMKFVIGNETDSSRYEQTENAALLVASSHNLPIEEFEQATAHYQDRKILCFGAPTRQEADFIIPYTAPVTPLRLFEHLATKLVLNIISTGVMVKMKRTTGNWMSYLNISNKKLIDRGIRIVADQCGLGYRNAAVELFASLEELEEARLQNSVSPVQYTIDRIGRNEPR